MTPQNERKLLLIVFLLPKIYKNILIGTPYTNQSLFLSKKIAILACFILQLDFQHRRRSKWAFHWDATFSLLWCHVPYVYISLQFEDSWGLYTLYNDLTCMCCIHFQLSVIITLFGRVNSIRFSVAHVQPYLLMFYKHHFRFHFDLFNNVTIWSMEKIMVK